MAIVNKAHLANQLYPFAISLIESVRTYERTLEKVCVLKIYLVFTNGWILDIIVSLIDCYSFLSYIIGQESSFSEMYCCEKGLENI